MNIFYIFTVSLCVMILMILVKIFQNHVFQIHFLSKLSLKGDEKIQDIIALFVGKYNLYKKIAHLFIFDFLPSYIYEILGKLKDYVARKYYLASSGIRGRRVLRDSGSVSFFLERLAEDKSDVTRRNA